jgi:hypothetical protein
VKWNGVNAKIRVAVYFPLKSSMPVGEEFPEASRRKSIVNQIGVSEVGHPGSINRSGDGTSNQVHRVGRAGRKDHVGFPAPSNFNRLRDE